MKPKSHETQVGHTGKRIRDALFSVMMGIATTAAPVAASADYGFQNNTLLDPSKSQLKTEARGHVTVYDGLENEVSEGVLDNQFEQIDRMIFTGSEHTQPEGDVIVEDDDC